VNDPMIDMIRAKCGFQNCTYPKCECDDNTAQVSLDDPKCIGLILEWPTQQMNGSKKDPVSSPSVGRGVIISVTPEKINVLCSVGVDPLCPPEFHGHMIAINRKGLVLNVKTR
jgi:hypothetical protein